MSNTFFQGVENISRGVSPPLFTGLVATSALVWQTNQKLTRSGVDPRESFQRAVIACQAPETFLFSNFPWEGELKFSL